VNEWAGIGNHLDFGARGYESRIGRWLAKDPKEAQSPNMSTYAFSFNNPIYFVDPKGKRGVASIKDASGTKKDPIVVTVTANYYYQNATDAQKAAMGNVTAELKTPKTFEEENGKYYSVIVNVSFKQSDNPAESAAKDIAQNGALYGNVFLIDPGTIGPNGESGHATNDEITVFDGGVTSKALSWIEEKNQKQSYQTIFRNVLIEEVLHNLGGLHQDGGAVPPMTTYSSGRSSMTDAEKPAQKNNYTTGNAQAIFRRIDKPLGTDAKENPKDKKGRDKEPLLRDEEGTSGEVKTDTPKFPTK
jgi:RHS repeat-associated protein